MDSYFYIAIAAIALALMFSLGLGYRLYRDNKQREANLKDEVLQLIAQGSPSGASVQELRKEINALRREVQGFGSRKNSNNQIMPLLTALLEKLDENRAEGQADLPMEDPNYRDDDHSVFTHAIRLAKEDQSVEKIVEICGIEASEAELIVRMHGHQPD